MPFQKGNQLWRKANHKGHAPTLLRPHTEEEKAKTSAKMREWHQNNPHPNKGKKFSGETKRKMSEARRGKSNANWKGGATELLRGIRRSPGYYQWRKQVLKRDLRTCRDCGTTTNINAHHLKSILEYPELVFDVYNGLTLCQDCHDRHTAWQRLNGRRKIKFKKRK